MSQQSTNPERSLRFESDTQKIVHRHLQNQNDTITEEDIRNVRIGMTPTIQPVTDEPSEKEDYNKVGGLTDSDIELANDI